MRPAFEVFRRPLLQVTRAHTEQACAAEGIAFWRDPHNEDPRFTRTRIRHRVMPVLEQELGPGIAPALARTAEMLAEDMAALADLAQALHEDMATAGGLAVERLTALVPALRRRILRAAAVDAGALDAELFRSHVLALDDLVGSPRGRQVQLPGHVTATVEAGVLAFGRTGGPAGPDAVAG